MWLDKRVVILGAARQGTALARWLVAHGARVTLSDLKPDADTSALGDARAQVSLALGGHPLALLDGCDVLCLSGGVPMDAPIVVEAQRRGVKLSNDAQIFLDMCAAPVIGITGSAGKTTTTTLVGEMLLAEKRSSASARARSVWVGGNIGNPLIADVDAIRANDLAVMELSSFQLELMTRSPHIACITNITPNHLDRHGTMDAYAAAKRHILDFQSAGDWAALNADDPLTAQLSARGGVARFSLRGDPHTESAAWMDARGGLNVRVGTTGAASVCHRSELQLMGDHNVLNALAAALVAGLAGASVESMRAVAVSFKGVLHRLQLVRELRGVRYYNDSIATAPERVVAALRCFEQPVVLLVGGRDKKLPWDEAIGVMRERCRCVVLFGELGPMVGEKIESQNDKLKTSEAMCVTRVGSLREAVGVAASAARAGDVVLLSPGGTSFDAFNDFAERGARFSEWVNELA